MKIIIKYILVIFLTFGTLVLNAQNSNNTNKIDGKVYSKSSEGKEALIGASVYWANTTIGTVTDNNGNFSLQLPKNQNNLHLVVSFMGYKADTFKYKDGNNWVDITLISSLDLDEIVIKGKRGSAYFSRASTFNIQNITGNEFKKAACCNLSESFETNASVDVSFSDAISGAKQINLLGLAGKYVQMNFENIPAIRGLAATYGLTYVPGPWMESIQISKGAASVRNGFESITGQINYEYKKPDTAERFYFNAVGNQFGRGESNFYSAHKLNDKWSTMLLGFVGYHKNKVDPNGDGFIDLPLSNSYQFLNRWKYMDDELMTQFGIGILDENRVGGQMNFDKEKDFGTTNAYGIEVNTRRYDAFWKGGFFPAGKKSTFAAITNFSHHQQSSYFGLNNYEGAQTNFNSNLIFSSIIGNPNHNYDLGASFMYDDYQESYNDSAFNRREVVPGAFFEYTYKSHDKISIIAGVRTDFHNLLGTLVTPRFHFRYKINDVTIVRMSAGKGYRCPNVFAENTALMATSRTLIFDEKLQKEEAWNYGVFITRDFEFAEIPFSVNLDFYRTDFVNQVIVDLDQNKGEVHFYNLDGRSFANSAQIEINFEPIERFEVLTAYRINDVRATFENELRIIPLTKRSKGILNLSYATKYEKWRFDYTLQYNGVSRLPNKLQVNEDKQYTPEFFIMNAQISKNFRHWEMYAGVENFTDFIQENPIIAYDKPFSNEFDASQVWAPIIGRKVYAGIRISLY